jgi:excisionase family DNA binding protein
MLSGTLGRRHLRWGTKSSAVAALTPISGGLRHPCGALHHSDGRVEGHDAIEACGVAVNLKHDRSLGDRDASGEEAPPLATALRSSAGSPWWIRRKIEIDPAREGRLLRPIMMVAVPRPDTVGRIGVAWLTVQEAAELLRVPVSWLYERTRTNSVPHVTLGKYLRFDRDELAAWIDELRRDGRGAGRRSTRPAVRAQQR